MKKIINNADNVANEMVNGIVKAHPALKLEARYRIIYREPSKEGRLTSANVV
jgi:dihydroxyacetone kinase